jgi:hypothetical protein
VPQRPIHFRLNTQNQLAKRLVFAGIGAHMGSERYHDSSAFGTTLTISGTPAITPLPMLGRIGLTLPGNTSKAEAVSSALPTAADSPFSISCWQNMTSAALSSLFGFGGQLPNASSGVNRYILVVNDKFMLWSGDADWDTGVAWTPGEQSHICFTSDGTYLRFYKNGQLLAGPTSRPAWTTAQTYITIGRMHQYGSFSFTGSYADGLIHGRALHSSEVQQIADPSNVMLSGLILPPCRQYWAIPSAATGNRRRRALIASA